MATWVALACATTAARRAPRASSRLKISGCSGSHPARGWSGAAESRKRPAQVGVRDTHRLHEEARGHGVEELAVAGGPGPREDTQVRRGGHLQLVREDLRHDGLDLGDRARGDPADGHVGQEIRVQIAEEGVGGEVHTAGAAPPVEAAPRRRHVPGRRRRHLGRRPRRAAGRRAGRHAPRAPRPTGRVEISTANPWARRCAASGAERVDEGRSRDHEPERGGLLLGLQRARRGPSGDEGQEYGRGGRATCRFDARMHVMGASEPRRAYPDRRRRGGGASRGRPVRSADRPAQGRRPAPVPRRDDRPCRLRSLLPAPPGSRGPRRCCSCARRRPARPRTTRPGPVRTAPVVVRPDPRRADAGPVLARRPVAGAHHGRDRRTPDVAPGVGPAARWSPADGRQVAFVSDRSGSAQVHVMHLAGGRPRAVTVHTRGLRPRTTGSRSGDALLVRRAAGSRLPPQRALLPPPPRSGGAPRAALRRLREQRRTLSPDGQRLAFVREGVGWARKGYRGSQAGQVWIHDLTTRRPSRRSPRASTASAARSGLPDGRALYVTSQEDGTFNLWRVDLASGAADPAHALRGRRGALPRHLGRRIDDRVPPPLRPLPARSRARMRRRSASRSATWATRRSTPSRTGRSRRRRPSPSPTTHARSRSSPAATCGSWTRSCREPRRDHEHAGRREASRCSRRTSSRWCSSPTRTGDPTSGSPGAPTRSAGGGRTTSSTWQRLTDDDAVAVGRLVDAGRQAHRLSPGPRRPLDDAAGRLRPPDGSSRAGTRPHYELLAGRDGGSPTPVQDDDFNRDVWIRAGRRQPRAVQPLAPSRLRRQTRPGRRTGRSSRSSAAAGATSRTSATSTCARRTRSRVGATARSRRRSRR